MNPDLRIEAPSAQRNRGPILEVLRTLLPARGAVLEVASGSGEHVVHFARSLPGLVFQPSDPDPQRRASIDAWAAGIDNVRPAADLDATQAWPAMDLMAVLCINMIHIAPWSATEGLMRNAGRALRRGGVLMLYGPFRRNGELCDSNAEFDADLRARNPHWGIRDLEEVAVLAERAGFLPPKVTAMPANNLCVAFRRAH